MLASRMIWPRRSRSLTTWAPSSAGVIAHGKLIAEGTLAELRARIGRESSLEDIFLDLVAEGAEAA